MISAQSNAEEAIGALPGKQHIRETVTGKRDELCVSPDASSIGDIEMETELADQYNNMTSQELEKVKEECKTNKHVKPPYSYIALITMAVLQVCSTLLKTILYQY